MATLKHISSKNADYGAAERYLTYEHDEFSGKEIRDKHGHLIPREEYGRMRLTYMHEHKSDQYAFVHLIDIEDTANDWLDRMMLDSYKAFLGLHLIVALLEELSS